jgi:hypothetical protein
MPQDVTTGVFCDACLALGLVEGLLETSFVQMMPPAVFDAGSAATQEGKSWVTSAVALITPALFSQPPPRPPGEEGEVCLEKSRNGMDQDGGSSRFTVPAPPSMVTTSPVFRVVTRPAMPTMVGMPISLATMAEWERMEPRSMRRPETEG